MKTMISEAQFYQIEDAKLLIGDTEVVKTISNPRLTAQQMQALIALACSHPMAQFDFYALKAGEQEQMTQEIRWSVRERAAQFLRQNKRARIPPRKTEVTRFER